MRDGGRSRQDERGELKTSGNEWKVLTCGKDCSRWERRLVSDFVASVRPLLSNRQLYTGSDELFVMLQRRLAARASFGYESAERPVSVY